MKTTQNNSPSRSGRRQHSGNGVVDLLVWTICIAASVALSCALAALMCAVRTNRASVVARGGNACVSARALYGLIVANLSKRRHDGVRNDGGAPLIGGMPPPSAVVHIAYDFSRDRVLLLLVTEQRVRAIGAYEIPKSNKHVRFDRTWDDMLRVYEHCTAQGRSPELVELASVTDIDRSYDVASRVRRAKCFSRLMVRIVDEGRRVEYSDARTGRSSVSVSLPKRVRASLVRDDDLSTVRVALFLHTPCSDPSVVTSRDFRDFYVGGAESSTGDEVDLSDRFSWSCRTATDTEPILIPRGTTD